MSKQSIFVFIAVLSIMTGAAFAGLDDGLVAYYPFNGDANNETGNGHDGTVYGTSGYFF
ncbi:MAG: hypothetical protein ACYSR5_05775 [Planctomycetota bacterium]|jgi:hypothetical protein